MGEKIKQNGEKKGEKRGKKGEKKEKGKEMRKEWVKREFPNLEDDAPPNDHPPTAQWEHGRGMKICTNPGLVMTTGAIKAIFDIPSLA